MTQYIQVIQGVVMKSMFIGKQKLITEAENLVRCGYATMGIVDGKLTIVVESDDSIMVRQKA
jgi:hypothetical protein